MSRTLPSHARERHRPAADRTARSAAPAPARWILGRMERHIDAGEIEIVLPDGTTRRLAGAAPGPHAVVQLNRMRALLRLATGGALGFARAYIDGDWDSPELADVIAFGAVNRRRLGRQLHGGLPSRLLARLGHLVRPNTRRQARRNIMRHYDLGNDFYTAWLDEGMTYSAGMFEPGTNSLEAAQRAKYRQIVGLLAAQPGEHLLEIGCGWGGFAEYAAAEHGLAVTAITISPAQYDYASARIARAGLSDRVTVRLQDYREIAGRYDHIVSIEMVEAVGERYWPVYFETIARALAPQGRAALQAITIAEDLFETYRRNADFIQAEIFPGGMLPSLGVLEQAARAAGLKRIASDRFGGDYATTLRLWRERFAAAARTGRLPEGLDRRFRRLWTYYLAYCEGGFRAGNIDLLQLAFTRV